jgi:hypothetical protein
VVSLLSLLLACAGDEPVLTAVQAPPPAAVEEAATRRKAQEAKASPEAAGGVDYAKPKGVYIDAPYFAGRSWDAARDEIARQFGAVALEETTPDKARLVTLERGKLRVVDGRIQTIEVPLPEPLRRTEALMVLGLPPVQDAYRAMTFEYRISNVHGFRRIRLFRAEREGETVNRVELWKFLNRERR